MATWKGAIQSPIVTQRFLNTAAWDGDPAPGSLLSTAQVSGSIVQDYAGMVGGILTLSEKDADYYTDPVTGQQLYAGDYQYVEFYDGGGPTTEQGQIVFWKTVLGSKYVVTPNFWASNPCAIAGIALCNVAHGHFWFIQVAGIAEVLFRNTIAKTSPLVCDLVTVGVGSRHADVLADATPIVPPLLKLVLGKAWAVAPAANTISPVSLGLGCCYYPGG